MTAAVPEDPAIPASDAALEPLTVVLEPAVPADGKVPVEVDEPVDVAPAGEVDGGATSNAAYDCASAASGTASPSSRVPAA